MWGRVFQVLMVPLWHMYSINQSDLICPVPALFFVVLSSRCARRRMVKKSLHLYEDDALSKPVIL